jgi:sec-independent protein translocase protein TatB
MMLAPQIELDSLGMADSLILMVLALVVFGPRRLPQIGRQIGKLMYEFRKASNDFKFQMEEELRLSEEADRRKKEEAQPKLIAAEAPALAPLNAIESESGTSSTPPVETSIEAPVEDTLHVQPPSTGETVAASRRVPPPPPEPVEAQILDPIGQLEQPADETKSDSTPATEAVSKNG